MKGLLITIAFSLATDLFASPGFAEEDGAGPDMPELAQPFLDDSTLAGDERLSVAPIADDATLAQACCRYCCTGKPCGNSCINRNLTCHQPPGCACWGC